MHRPSSTPAWRRRAPEEQLVLLAARPRHDAAAAAEARELAGAVDWTEVLRLANAAATLARLGHVLATMGVDVPPPVASELVGARLLTTRFNRTATTVLAGVLDTLAGAGVSALPFKGPDLAIRCYGTVWARRFSDVDVLVRADDFAVARSALVGAGLTIAPDRPRSTTVTLVDGDRGIAVDLGCMVSGLPDDFCWERPATVELDDRTYPAIAPEPLLVALCVHGSKHFWEALQWICDVACTVDAFPDLDWDGCLDLAERLDVRRVVSIGLLLAADLLAVELPAPVEAAARADGRAARLAARVAASVFSPTEGARVHLTRTRYSLGLADTLPAKAAVLRLRAGRLTEHRPARRRAAAEAS